MTFPAAKLKRRPIMRYTDAANLKVIYSVSGDGYDDYVEAVGNPDNASYEWLIRRGDEVVKHSDCGYGMASIALRDGLIECFGLPTAPDLLSAARAAEAYISGARAELAIDRREALETVLPALRAAIAKAEGQS